MPTEYTNHKRFVNPHKAALYRLFLVFGLVSCFCVLDLDAHQLGDSRFAHSRTAVGRRYFLLYSSSYSHRSVAIHGVL